MGIDAKMMEDMFPQLFSHTSVFPMSQFIQMSPQLNNVQAPLSLTGMYADKTLSTADQPAGSVLSHVGVG